MPTLRRLSHARERPGLGQPGQPVRAPVDEALERRAEVRRAEPDDVAQLRHPLVVQRVGLVGGAAADQPAERVPDDRDLGDLDRPHPDELLELLGQLAPVVRDVHAGVEVQVDRRPAVVVAQHRAVGARAVAPALLGRERPAQVGLAQPVREHRQAGRWRCRTARRRRRGWPGRAAAGRRAAACASAGASAGCRSASRSPKKPLTAPRTNRPRRRVVRRLGGRVLERAGDEAGHRRQVLHAQLGRAVRDRRDAVVHEPDRAAGLAGQPEQPAVAARCTSRTSSVSSPSSLPASAPASRISSARMPLAPSRDPQADSAHVYTESQACIAVFRRPEREWQAGCDAASRR